MVYPYLSAALRDDASFRSQSDERHHKGTSELERLPIDMVKDFPSDFLHLGVLGITKKFVLMWTTPSQFKLSPFRIRRLNSSLTSIKRFCSLEFSRKTGSTKDATRWKGTEYYNFLMYTGMVALFDVLPESQYKHFLMFCIAMRNLCSEVYCRDEEMLTYADQLLRGFVVQSTSLYGSSFYYGLQCTRSNSFSGRCETVRCASSFQRIFFRKLFA